MTDQLALFPETDATQSVDFIGWCRYGCGARTEPIHHDDVGKPWSEPIMWALLTVTAHERVCDLNPNRDTSTTDLDTQENR
jgi:hypothetical protein